MTDINAACGAVEEFLATYRGLGGLAPAEAYVHPSGDDADVIKIWVDLGQAGAGADTHAWGQACEAAIRAALDVAPWRLQIRVESGI